ncbi:hypothetical protein C8F04DRAFT_1150498 [Mycena alexandri]|uniref:Uncharacterized protein n=1 Tax=Mycena alexandri TaxID=1745969 RepID=A0AAD6RZX2_9AGAR|nr:hypothetical protein C8F04DRAFT_1150498 [Mycena alexandri]
MPVGRTADAERSTILIYIINLFLFPPSHLSISLSFLVLVSCLSFSFSSPSRPPSSSYLLTSLLTSSPTYLYLRVVYLLSTHPPTASKRKASLVHSRRVVLPLVQQTKILILFYYILLAFCGLFFPASF